MSDSLEIEPCGPVRGVIQPPGSKSITNRALLCAALAHGESELSGLLDSDDTRLMVAALRQLGVNIGLNHQTATAHVTGCAGDFPVKSAELFVGNSGTTIRFLAAAVSTNAGRFRLDGVPRMRQRPIGALVDALRQLGVEARANNHDQFPPIEISSTGWSAREVSVAGTESSQFLSGLLLAAPYAPAMTTISVTGQLVSRPYVNMTLRIMQQFGASVRVQDHRYEVDCTRRYRGVRYRIEPDASAASYFWAAAAVSGGSVTVQGLSSDSIQGDVGFCDCLRAMGCQVDYAGDSTTVTAPSQRRLRGIEVDMNQISDTVPTLAVVALFAHGPTIIKNVAHIRYKETDRIGDLARELRKLGARVHEHDDGLVIEPGPTRPAEICTYDDHRMAMAFSIAGLCVAGVKILHPDCTSKTYPGYFADLAALCRSTA